MLTSQDLAIIASVGFLASATGGLGSELLDRFTGRTFEAYCRMKRRRERFGQVLDLWEVALSGAEYLRIIGTSTFLVSGSAALITHHETVSGMQLLSWLVLFGTAMMFAHIWLPTAVTRFMSAPVLYYTWPFWRVLAFLMRPLSAPGLFLAAVAARMTGQSEDDEESEEDALEDEIRTIVAAGARDGLLGHNVREMIQGVMELHEDTVSHIMTPRSEVDALDAKTPWPQVLQLVGEYGRTRLPVYEGSLDHVVGILYVKDLLSDSTNGAPTERPLVDILRRSWEVPASKRVDELLRDFQQKRSHMAIVVDEFGLMAGVVTIEDALEEIVGDIVDESDEEELAELNVVNDQTVEASGRAMIDEVNEKLGWDLPEEEDYETVAGMVLHHTGEMPVAGTELIIGPIKVQVLRASGLQIERVRLQRVDVTEEVQS